MWAGTAWAGVPKALPGATAFPTETHAALSRALASRPADWEPRTRHRAADGAPLYTNRLALEPSPYLQQHAHNPVNWYPWGDEAFEAARRLDRPVLVSIGYSTCHWCHVMEEESFDDVATARLLNERFIAVKVDREVRPDVDSIYMTALHALQGRGGWPLNMFLTPDRAPFYGGTYFPPVGSRNRPGFRQVLEQVSEAFATDRTALERDAATLSARVAKALSADTARESSIPDTSLLDRATRAIDASFDDTWGGHRGRTKFPATLPIRFLLRQHRRTGDARALEMATRTLERMAAGGLHDPIGGGFHRYATDTRWLVPHFEKMLYDNALLTLAYVEAWQATGRDDFADVARHTLDYLLREMTSPEGGFYSATDADSLGPDGEREEGRFFTWTPAEIEGVLGAQSGPAMSRFFGVTQRGHVEGRSVLHRALPRGTPRPAGFERAVEALYAARASRPPPLRDEKILAAWNGLAISAFARASLALGEARYVDAARRAAGFVLSRMRPRGQLARSFANGRSEGSAFLEDHAFVIAGLIDLYEADADPRWLSEALALQGRLDAHYADAAGGGYFRTPDDGEALLAREKPNHDGAEPSGNSVAILNLLRLAELTTRDDYRTTALMALSAFRARLDAAPTALGEMLLAVDFLLDTPKEILIVRGADDAQAEGMLAPLRRTFCPNRVVSVVAAGSVEEHVALVPILAGKRAIAGETTAYVCEHGVCAYPARDPETFARQLAPGDDGL
ncbi:MAG: thioredoxin domain-containing protein [Deltaproteobacteria bacterium]|nr:thioredoxin domain-containing protein [Deltaproteobacteria bacterium]MBW2446466.1 thioredoxin domain-containing protein [Deltaproteobacteria bacterium]